MAARATTTTVRGKADFQRRDASLGSSIPDDRNAALG